MALASFDQAVLKTWLGQHPAARNVCDKAHVSTKNNADEHPQGKMGMEIAEIFLTFREGSLCTATHCSL